MAETTYFDRTYDEALQLLEEAQSYAMECARADATVVMSVPQLSVTCEQLRITTRLAEVVAWLLTQKAVHAGELTPTEAVAPERRLGSQELCLHHDEALLADMPPRLRDLAERSYHLYQRIARLDRQVRASAA